MKQLTRILILGGGFGGLSAANELRKTLTGEHEITLIDGRDRFFVGFAKLWDLTGERSLEKGSRPLSNLNKKGIRFVQSNITRIDPGNKVVETADGTFEADFILVALGAAYSPQQVSKFLKSGHNLYDAQALPQMRRELESLDGGKVLVAILGLPYKCPPAPYEAAFMIDKFLRARDKRPRVELEVCTPQPSPLPIAGPEASKRVSASLQAREIALKTEHVPSDADPAAKVLSFENDYQARYALLLGVPQHVAPAVVADSPLAGKSGWIEPDRKTLRTSFEGVYAVGDCTVLQTATGQLPKAGVFAEAEGKVVAANIAAEILGGEGAEFDGRGFCFLDFADGKGSYVEGDFFAEPKPNIAVSPPDENTIQAKHAFEQERLNAWLPLT